MRNLLFVIALVCLCGVINAEYVKGQKMIEKVSVDHADLADGVNAIWTIPAGAMIFDVKVKTTEIFATSTAELIGDGTHADGYVANGFGAATGLYPEFASATAGQYVSSTATSYKYYSAADTMDLSVDATPSAGAFDLFVEFMVF